MKRSFFLAIGDFDISSAKGSTKNQEYKSCYILYTALTIKREYVISATLLRNNNRPWEVLTGHGYWNGYG